MPNTFVLLYIYTYLVRFETINNFPTVRVWNIFMQIPWTLAAGAGALSILYLFFYSFISLQEYCNKKQWFHCMHARINYSVEGLYWDLCMLPNRKSERTILHLHVMKSICIASRDVLPFIFEYISGIGLIKNSGIRFKWTIKTQNKNTIKIKTMSKKATASP